MTLAVVAKKHIQIALFFNLISNMLNIIGASCKHRYVPIKKEVTKVIESLKNEELSSGWSLNQEMSYRRTSDTR